MEIEIINGDEMRNLNMIKIRPIAIPIVNCPSENSNLGPLPPYALYMFETVTLPLERSKLINLIHHNTLYRPKRRGGKNDRKDNNIRIYIKELSIQMKH